MTQSPSVQSETIQQEYSERGYCLFRQVLDAALIAEASDHVDWLLRKHPELRPEQLHHYLAQYDPFWVRLVSDNRLLDIAQLFVGPNIALYGTHYICKPPFTGQRVLWHQDGSYWPLEPMEVVTLFLAITESTPENGCMRVIPGTHRMELQELQERKDVENVLESGLDEALVDASQAVDLVLAPGDVSVHNPNIVHGSNANTSPAWRRALTIRYIPATTRILREAPGPHECAFLLRGAAVPGVNEYNPRPRYIEGEWMPFRGCEAFR